MSKMMPLSGYPSRRSHPAAVIGSEVVDGMDRLFCPGLRSFMMITRDFHHSANQWNRPRVVSQISSGRQADDAKQRKRRDGHLIHSLFSMFRTTKQRSVALQTYAFLTIESQFAILSLLEKASHIKPRV